MNPRTQKVYASQRAKMIASIGDEDCSTFNHCFYCDYNDKLDEFLESIENINTRKNYYANVVSFLKNEMEDYPAKENDIKCYRERMLQLCAIVNNQSKQQQKSQKQEDNWFSINELQKMRKKMLVDLKDRTNLNWKDIQPFFVSSLYLADDKNPPIRNEYGDMVVVFEKDGIHSQDNSRNYLVITGRNKKQFVLNDYKTAKTHGQKVFKVGNKLNKIINQFIKYHPISTGDTPESPLLYNSINQSLGRNGLTKYLQNKVFNRDGKKISTAMLRHIYISEKVQMPLLKEKEELADKMCHTTGLQELYKKE
jgi:hypothetical protein